MRKVYAQIFFSPGEEPTDTLELVGPPKVADGCLMWTDMDGVRWGAPLHALCEWRYWYK